MSGAVEGVALLPCPFCGGEAASDVYAGTARDFYTIGCNNDLCAASCHFTGYEGLEPLIPLWNARTTPPARSYADGVVVELLQRWERACDQHNALLASGEDVTGAKVKRSGSKCASLYSQLTTASIAAIRLLSQGGKA
jgi:hypothetical protein